MDPTLKKILIAVAILLGLVLIYWFVSAQMLGSNGQERSLSAKEVITNLLAERHNREVGDVTVEIEKSTQNHVRGTVVLYPGGARGTGIFFAVYSSGNWEIVYEGAGNFVYCSVLEPHGFPPDMMSGCFKPPSEL